MVTTYETSRSAGNITCTERSTDLLPYTADITTSAASSTTVVNRTTSTLPSGQCLYHNGTPTNNVITCRTFCKVNSDRLTDVMLQRWLISVVEDLTLNKKRLSSYIRKHVSADNKQLTSKALGLCGVCLMLAFFSVIVLSDAINLCQGKYRLVTSKAAMARYAVTKTKKAKPTTRRRAR
ncbi:uncharacterized protein LOC117319150 [Pecten maximus]|uniref:uncharacterized protein LOC117319150 n=1 Tax=Pecten maximus TaxID=6579 RepID=UPI001458C4CE|nr:uncharacterized protein LOC117319150 [Pecten maximus]